MVILVRVGENDAGHVPVVLSDDRISCGSAVAIETIDNDPLIGWDAEQNTVYLYADQT